MRAKKEAGSGVRQREGAPALAIYHLAVKSVSRATGRSAPAAAAYRAGERIENLRDGLVHDYRARGGVEDTLIVTPAGAEWALDRSALWNAAEVAEKRKDAKVAREYELALPAELTKGQRLELVREFAEAVCERYGVAVDAALHSPHDYGDDRNHHAHVLTTTREVTPTGLGAKTRQLDVSTTASIEVEAIRALWAEQANAALKRAGSGEQIDHRSLAAQGVERVPTMHLGATAAALERENVPTRRGEHNRAVANDNEVQERLSAEIVDLRAERDARQAATSGAPVATPTAAARGIEADRRREGAREPGRAATAAPGHMLMDAAYALASSAQDREAIAVMNALTRLFRRLGPIAEAPRKVAAPLPTARELVRRREAELVVPGGEVKRLAELLVQTVKETIDAPPVRRRLVPIARVGVVTPQIRAELRLRQLAARTPGQSHDGMLILFPRGVVSDRDRDDVLLPGDAPRDVARPDAGTADALRRQDDRAGVAAVPGPAPTPFPPPAIPAPPLEAVRATVRVADQQEADTPPLVGEAAEREYARLFEAALGDGVAAKQLPLVTARAAAAAAREAERKHMAL